MIKKQRIAAALQQAVLRGQTLCTARLARELGVSRPYVRQIAWAMGYGRVLRLRRFQRGEGVPVDVGVSQSGGSRSPRLSVPAGVLRLAGIKIGDKVVIRAEDDYILIVRRGQ